MRKILGAFVGVMLCGMGIATPPPAGADEQKIGSAWTIDQAAYTAQASGDIVRFSAELTIKILQDGYQEIPLAFSSAVITDVKASGAGVTLIARNDQYALAVQKKGTCKVKVRFSAPLTRDDRYEQVHVGIPQAVFSRLTLEIPRTDVELAPDQALTVEKEVRKESVVLACTLGLSRQIHLRWAARPVQQEPVEPSFLTDLRVLTNLEEESLRMVALIRYQVLQGQIKSVAFDLPAGLSVLSVRSAEIEDWKAAPAGGGQRVTVSFREPLKIGTTQLIVEAEQSLSRPAGQVVFPSIITLESKRVTGYLAVATGTSMELEDPAMQGLRRLDVREIPEDLRSLATAPVVAAFRYQQAPYKLTAGLRQPEHLAVLVAIAESGDLATVVTPTGEAITRAVYQIRNNKKASLAVTLPEGTTLWSVLVDQRSVKPAAGPEGRILVPLAVGSGPERSFPVEIVYVEKTSPFKWVGGKEYKGPELDVPMTAVRWNLFMPEEVRGYWFAGNLQRHLRVAGFLPEPTVIGEVLLVRRSTLQKSSAGRAGDSFLDASSGAPAAGELNEFRQAIAGVQQSGVLPFRIAIPASGRSHLFSRLLTTTEPLTIRVRYVKVAPQVFPLTAGIIGLAGFLLLFRSRILPGLRRRSAVEAPASN